MLDRAKTEEKRAALEAELSGPPFPVALAYLWSIFLRLHNRRGSSGMGLAPIGWGEIADFSRLTQIRLQPWEIEFIEALDDAYLAAGAKKGAG